MNNSCIDDDYSWAAKGPTGPAGTPGASGPTGPAGLPPEIQSIIFDGGNAGIITDVVVDCGTVD